MATSTSCMNPLCGASTSSTGSKKGWILRSGDYAILCDTCGSAYEQSGFCDVFHSNESGWRQCTSCGKRLHCGCSASRFMVELLDYGGVNCINCFKSSRVNTPLSVDNHVNGEQKIVQLGNITEGNGQRNFLRLHNDERLVSFTKMKQEDAFHSAADIGSSSFSQFRQASNGFHQTPQPDGSGLTTAVKESAEPLLQTNLSITLGSSALGNPNPFAIAAIDERGQSKASCSLQQGPKSHHLLPKPLKSTLSTNLEANTNMVSQIRVARPPAEGRGRNQLLPRYWPRITDQELQQLCGDSNSTIVPLFEKVLSASDAGRIGRLVLPKACAEAYFPPISQPEGLPLRIQDVKGKEWVFQFRFWPNNNSRMYVLEGVTPCIQSMQLQAGDTVTFSRMDPEGKLVMGFRKASNSVSVQSLKGSNDTHLHALSKHLHPAPGDINWYRSEKYDDGSREALLSSLLTPERKRMRNIGSKSKRLLVDSMDAMEIKLTWEEAQDLLRPPPSVKPSIMTIEDHDFEEYEEPPVFGKSGVYVVRPTGGPEQWVQCDSCCKWRRLPADVLLPAKWTCMDNVWDEKRCSCSAPDELTPRELESLLLQNKDLHKRRTASSHRPVQHHESSGLDSLANVAMLGEVGDQETTTIATTTKHPRHRPGCSCIVCIQPPSGKGKHKPTCTCKICMTVKRRFKTLMMRKRKRQSEHEAEIAQRNQPLWGFKDEAEVQSNSKNLSPNQDPSENEATNELESKSQGNNQLKADSNIDLNYRPDSEDVSKMGLNRTSMMGLLQVAGLPLETYLKQNGLTSLVSEQQTSSAMHVSPQTGESEGQTRENHQFTPPIQEQESSHEEDEAPAPNESRVDPV